MGTTWTKETSISPSSWTKDIPITPSSSWTLPSPLQSDIWAGLDELFNLMTDEDDNIILFHTGDYSDQDTIWTKD